LTTRCAGNSIQIPKPELQFPKKGATQIFKRGQWLRKPASIDPIIRGLLARLPKSGDVWPEGQRQLRLELLEGSFKLIYKDKSDSKVRSHDQSMESVLKKD
jgi:hypothetical protein